MSEQQIAIAVLFSGDPETGDSSMDVFRDDDEFATTWSDGSKMDPYHRASALKAVTADDFPERLWSIALNERATVLMRNARMRAMGFVGEGYEEYADV